MDDGSKRIEDKELRAQLRRQARKVYIEAMLAGALLTAFWLALP